MEKVDYYCDTYALVEIVKRNPNYAPFREMEMVITLMNLAELYYSVLKDFGQERADEIFSLFRRGVREIDDDTLKDAMRFRLAHKKKDMSYVDCIRYIYAKRHGLKFLTGDKEFEDLPNVEFVK